MFYFLYSLVSILQVNVNLILEENLHLCEPPCGYWDLNSGPGRVAKALYR